MILKLSPAVHEFYETNNIDSHDAKGPVPFEVLEVAVTDLLGHGTLATEDVTVGGGGMEYLDTARELTLGSCPCIQDDQDQKEWLHSGETAYNLNVCTRTMKLVVVEDLVFP